MVVVGQDDILRALKHFKRIAKQELLVNDSLPQTEIHKTHAEARRTIYSKLIQLIEESGVENACVFAFNEYLGLPDNHSQDNLLNPSIYGQIQALEMFFNIIGVQVEQLHKFKIEHLNPCDFLSLISEPELYCLSQ